MLETINYNKVDPVIKWAQIFTAVATIKFTFFSIKKHMDIKRTYLIKYQQSIVK